MGRQSWKLTQKNSALPPLNGGALQLMPFFFSPSPPASRRRSSHESPLSFSPSRRDTPPNITYLSPLNGCADSAQNICRRLVKQTLLFLPSFLFFFLILRPLWTGTATNALMAAFVHFLPFHNVMNFKRLLFNLTLHNVCSFFLVVFFFFRQKTLRASRVSTRKVRGSA